ncbi:MAG: phenylalanine--tRNA ligase subunit alpha [Candidatus Pacearchaeota archaeon]|nr:phenylalanine--tRNA ligase subunit alpha [Candidatus Pacearchaeota archaeon]
MKREVEDVILRLSPLEKQVLPFLHLKDLRKIDEQTKLGETAIRRAIKFLESKGLVIVKTIDKKIVELDVNGILYLKKNLPERNLLNVILEAKENLSLDEAKKLSELSDNEFTIALGTLKDKALINIVGSKIELKASREEATRKFLEEKFLEKLPLELEKLNEEQKFCFNKLKSRKKIIRVVEQQEFEVELNEFGLKVLEELPKFKQELIEQLTPEMLLKESWQGKKFRKYDIKSKAPEIYGGKRHFVNQAIEYARKIWTEMGFEEMQGSLVQTAFWNFDALFTAQDHPVREMQDTFYIKDIKGKLPKHLVNRIKKVHESGIKGSKGWQYKWQEEEAKRVVLRTHTTCLSAHTLAKLGELKNNNKNLKGKFFAIGKCFRNETVDWSHSFEFNQTEGIVIDKSANFRHLLGYLKEFFKKMGWEKIRFRPSYFPYTEPSLEIDVFVPEKNVWLELGGAGILRPEVVVPLVGEWIPVLAWGPGFDRIIMDYYEIKDLREMYKNDLNKLRKIKAWMK